MASNGTTLELRPVDVEAAVPRLRASLGDESVATGEVM
jgi:hypothetical protein